MILTFVGGTLSNLLVPLLSVNSSLNRLLLVGNTFLELKDSASSILLLLLNVLHQLVEGVLGLESFLLSASLLRFFNYKDGLLVLKSLLTVGTLNFCGNEILLHTVEHVQVGSLAHSLLIDLGFSCFLKFSELLETVFVSEHWSLSILLLDLQLFNLLLDLLKFVLFESELFFGLVMLFLDLRQLD